MTVDAIPPLEINLGGDFRGETSDKFTFIEI